MGEINPAAARSEADWSLAARAESVSANAAMRAVFDAFGGADALQERRTADLVMANVRVIRQMLRLVRHPAESSGVEPSFALQGLDEADAHRISTRLNGARHFYTHAVESGSTPDALATWADDVYSSAEPWARHESGVDDDLKYYNEIWEQEDQLHNEKLARQGPGPDPSVSP